MNVVVIGGGAAGLMAAGTAAEYGANVTIVEKMPRTGRKILITGKGRCNVTNKTDINGLMASVRTNNKFLYSAFGNFDADDTCEFFENMGVPLKVERGNRVFPVSDKAMDIADALLAYTKKNGVSIVYDRAVEIKTENSAVVSVICESGKEIFADRIILATGGKSYPTTGSDGDGYKLASDCGHTVIKPRPSLVGIDIKEKFCAELAGLSLKNVVFNLYKNGSVKPIYSELGEMLFTHTGVSGPLVLTASAYIRDDEKYRLTVDLKPALCEKKLDERVLRDFAKYSNKNFSNSLGDLLPKSIIPVIVALSGIAPDVTVNKISREQRKKLVGIIKNIELNVEKTASIKEAIITAGGISTKEISPKSMESKLIGGLYFAGEIIDVDALTGGFNLQIAFSTGRLAGINCIG